MGVNITAFRVVLILLSSVLGVARVCRTDSFVGIAVPHLCNPFGTSNRSGDTGVLSRRCGSLSAYDLIARTCCTDGAEYQRQRQLCLILLVVIYIMGIRKSSRI